MPKVEEKEIEVTTRFTRALGANLKVPDRAQCVPDEVRHASDRAEAVKVAYSQAGAELRAAEAGLAQAKAADEAADREAIALGKHLPDKRAAEAAARALQAADRRMKATTAELEHRQMQLAQIIYNYRDEWLPQQEVIIEEQKAKIQETLTELFEQFITLRVEREVLQGLQTIEQGALTIVRFGAEAESAQTTANATLVAHAERSQDIGGSGRNTTIHDGDPTKLVAELVVLTRRR